LMAFADHMVTEGFVKADYRELLMVDADPAALLDRFETYEPPAPPKWAAAPPGI
jgi:predicted Rossmann-fold nucleotide-binding protein